MAELAEKLPLEYEYLRVDTSPDSYQIRVKGITTAEEANARYFTQYYSFCHF
jgi:hypothetical protein